MSYSQVRKPAVSGSFYPDDPSSLKRQVDSDLAANPSHPTGRPKALIVPHAGYIYSGPVAARAYNLLRPYVDEIKKVVILGPAHRVPLEGMALPECEYFRTPLGDIPIDQNTVGKLKMWPQLCMYSLAHAQEHSLEVQLPFLQRILKDFSLVPIVVGCCEAEQVAEVLDSLWGEEETLFIISSDLSHFHCYEEAQRIDQETSQMICELKDSLVGEQACGCYSVNGLLRILKRKNHKLISLDLRNSGDTAGGKDRVVGYGAYVAY